LRCRCRPRRRRAWGDPTRAAAAVQRRGWQIFELAFLFRLQALVLGQGPLSDLLKVDMFVYWIHGEMVYGLTATPIRRQLSLEAALVAFAIFTAFLFLLVLTKDEIVSRWNRSPIPDVGVQPQASAG
jgi:hypothetical protein